MHVLDLPNLKLKPNADELVSVLQSLKKKQLRNFSSSSSDEDEGMISGLFSWLTMIVGSSLDWVEDCSLRDEIWSLASTRMAERCGRSAQPTQKRQVDIPMLSEALSKRFGTTVLSEIVELVEPSLTSDNLGLKTWGSSFILARRLVSEFCKNKMLMNDVLELGSGTGLCGIVCARLGYRVTVTDLPEIVGNLQKNVDLNCMDDEDDIRAQVLDWSDYTADGIMYNTIIVSDPIYSPSHPQMVVGVIDKLLTKRSEAKLVVQLPLREKYEVERANFYNLLQAIGLNRREYEEESGFDDFGESMFAWSTWSY